jgi:phosphoserine phosphatase RsbU/P
MRRLVLLLALLLTGLPLGLGTPQAPVRADAAPFAEAQNRSPAANAINVPPGTVELSNGWRTHAGDDPAFAQSSFDDSSWSAVSIGSDTAVPGDWRWFRLKLTLPAGSPPLTVLVMAPGGTYEAYINGQRIPGPRIRSWLTVTEDQPQIIRLPNGTNRLELALRFHRPEQMVEIFNPSLNIFLGSTAAIRDQASAIMNGNLLQFLPTAAISLAIVVSGVGLLGFFLTQRSSPEYLWLGIYLVLMGSSEGLWTSLSTGLLPISVNSLYADPAIYLQTIAQIEFTYAFIRREAGRGWRWYQLLLLALTVTGPLSWFFTDLMRWITVSAYTFLQAAAILPAALGLPVILLFWSRKGNREAGWLILPSLLPAAGIVAGNIGFIASLFGWHSLAFLVNPLRLGPLSLQPSDLADAVFLLAIGVVIFLRIVRGIREQAAIEIELRSAGEVQHVLIPEALPEVPGYAIASAYYPAQEVGGDFFQIIPLDSGATLIVLGDVSGKGLKAAMNVAVIIGAVRTLAEFDSGPASILAGLNRRLVGRMQGGFTTALALKLDRFGHCILSNAGHLSPFLNGSEFVVGGSLPLGIVAEAEFVDQDFVLRDGDFLTVFTDGIPEARDNEGDLYGFERMAVLLASRPSAESVASAASTFGQDDDITVLTIERIPASQAPSSVTVNPSAVWLGLSR